MATRGADNTFNNYQSVQCGHSSLKHTLKHSTINVATRGADNTLKHSTINVATRGADNTFNNFHSIQCGHLEWITHSITSSPYNV